eukprot:1193356-Prorocentrum_minimum.AAC.2
MPLTITASTTRTCRGFHVGLDVLLPLPAEVVARHLDGVARGSEAHRPPPLLLVRPVAALLHKLIRRARRRPREALQRRQHLPSGRYGGLMLATCRAPPQTGTLSERAAPAPPTPAKRTQAAYFYNMFYDGK